ncbi:hypothetical protein CYMTET_37949 [Cymbomonas tetramitiformis]|uniref:Uncharacterized protein n=1 Tax=Cymbomonas tetramitiformis TaxID=36881 RepID=A0AAE0F5Y4_9CHLO|nr:hypothetical protein CYMTET_37949 [Cymbomonas tetramitiformis]
MSSFLPSIVISLLEEVFHDDKKLLEDILQIKNDGTQLKTDSAVIARCVGKEKAGVDKAALEDLGLSIGTKQELAEVESLKLVDEEGFGCLRKGCLFSLHSEEASRRKVDIDIMRRFDRLKKVCAPWPGPSEDQKLKTKTDWERFAHQTCVDLLEDMRDRAAGSVSSQPSSPGTVRKPIFHFGASSVFLMEHRVSSGTEPGPAFVRTHLCSILKEPSEAPRLLRGNDTDRGELVAFNLAAEITDAPNYVLCVVAHTIEENKQVMVRYLDSTGSAHSLLEVALDVQSDVHYIVQPEGREAFNLGQRMLSLLQDAHSRKLDESERQELDRYFDEMTYEDEEFAVYMGQQLPAGSAFREVALMTNEEIDTVHDGLPYGSGKPEAPAAPTFIQSATEHNWDPHGRSLYRIKLLQKKYELLQDGGDNSGQGSAHASETTAVDVLRTVAEMGSQRRDSLQPIEVSKFAKTASEALEQGELGETAVSSGEGSGPTLLNQVPDVVDLPGFMFTWLDEEIDPGWDPVALAQMVLQDNPLASEEHETRGAVPDQRMQVIENWTLQAAYTYADLCLMLQNSGCEISEPFDFNQTHTPEMIEVLKGSAACTDATDPLTWEPKSDKEPEPQRWGFLLSFKLKNKRLQPELAFVSTVKTMVYEMPKDCPYADAILILHPRHDCEVLPTVAEALFFCIEKFQEVEGITRIALPAGHGPIDKLQTSIAAETKTSPKYLDADLSEEMGNSGVIVSYQKLVPDQQVNKILNKSGTLEGKSIIPAFKASLKCERNLEFRFEVVQGMRVTTNMHKEFAGVHRFVCLTWVGQWHATYMAINGKYPKQGDVTCTMFQAPAVYERKLEMKRKEKYAGDYPHVRITKKSGAKASLTGVVTRLVEARKEGQLTPSEIQKENENYRLFNKVLGMFWKKIEEAEKLCKEAGGKFEARKWCLAGSVFSKNAPARVVGKIILGNKGQTTVYEDFPKAPSTQKTTTPIPGGKGKAPVVRVPMDLAEEDDSSDEDMGDVGRRGAKKQPPPEAVAMHVAKQNVKEGELRRALLAVSVNDETRRLQSVGDKRKREESERDLNELKKAKEAVEAEKKKADETPLASLREEMQKKVEDERLRGEKQLASALSAERDESRQQVLLEENTKAQQALLEENTKALTSRDSLLKEAQESFQRTSAETAKMAHEAQAKMLENNALAQQRMLEKNADTLKEINNHHASEAAAMREILKTAVQAVTAAGPFAQMFQLGGGGFYPGAPALGAVGGSPALTTPTGSKVPGASPPSRPAMFASPPRLGPQWPGQFDLTPAAKADAEKIGESLWTDLKCEDTDKKRSAIAQYNGYKELAQHLEVSEQVLRAKVIVQTFDLYMSVSK